MFDDIVEFVKDNVWVSVVVMVALILLPGLIANFTGSTPDSRAPVTEIPTKPRTKQPGEQAPGAEDGESPKKPGKKVPGIEDAGEAKKAPEAEAAPITPKDEGNKAKTDDDEKPDEEAKTEEDYVQPILDGPLVVGDRVELRGLVSAAMHNRMIGRVLALPPESDADTGRYQVMLFSGKKINARPANLVRAPVGCFSILKKRDGEDVVIPLRAIVQRDKFGHPALGLVFSNHHGLDALRVFMAGIYGIDWEDTGYRPEAILREAWGLMTLPCNCDPPMGPDEAVFNQQEYPVEVATMMRVGMISDTGGRMDIGHRSRLLVGKIHVPIPPLNQPSA